MPFLAEMEKKWLKPYPSPEETLRRYEKKHFFDMRKLGSRFRFFGDWKLIGIDELVFESNDTFKVIERGKHWKQQVAKLKEQGFREVVSDGRG